MAPSLVVVLLIPLFLSLGIWQLNRAEQKREIKHLQLSRMNQAPLELSTNPSLNADQAEYRSIVAFGTLLPEKSILIENRKFRGRQGFHVVAPLRIAGDGRYLLINRGWIPASDNLKAPSFSTPEGLVTVIGRATRPTPPALRLHRVIDQEPGQHWPYLTLDEYREWSGLDLYPFLLLQTNDQESTFIRDWPLDAADDTMHIGYAIQWFAFAVIALGIWLKLSLVHSVDQREAINGNH